MAFHDDTYSPGPGFARRRLEQHLQRRGIQDSLLNDPISGYRYQMLRDLVVLVEMALQDENVESDVIRHVIDKIIYGGSPQRAEAEMRIAEHAARVRDAMYRWPSETH